MRKTPANRRAKPSAAKPPAPRRAAGRDTRRVARLPAGASVLLAMPPRLLLQVDGLVRRARRAVPLGTVTRTAVLNQLVAAGLVSVETVAAQLGLTQPEALALINDPVESLDVSVARGAPAAPKATEADVAPIEPPADDAAGDGSQVEPAA